MVSLVVAAAVSLLSRGPAAIKAHISWDEWLSPGLPLSLVEEK